LAQPRHRRAGEPQSGQLAPRGGGHAASTIVKAVVQRVSRARSTPGGQIGPGLCVLLGVADGDVREDAERLAGKVARLRIFQNDEGKFDLSLLDVDGEALVVSQFTLLADSKRQKGTRPDFSKAATKDVAEPLYELFCDELRGLGVHVETGVFAASMQVEIVNDGPVTIVLET
jgi:D-tyrosyl-tRNA(Tyr) deacylase